MREIFTDKNFALSKILIGVKIFLIASLFIFFLPFLMLPFFNHPFADDYFYGYQLAARGFIGYQSFIYRNWDGRFAQTFITSLFVNNKFLFSHYYLHSLLLLCLNLISVFFLVTVLDKFVLKENLSFSGRLLFSFTFFALEVSCLPQCATFLFWFSSVITYQLPVILTQTEFAIFIVLFNLKKSFLRNACVVLFPGIVFITIGLNELFIVVQLLIYSVLYFFKWYKKCGWLFITLNVLAFIAATALLISAPGNGVRMSGIDPKGFKIGGLTLAYHSLQALWTIFKTPYIWFTAVVIFLYAKNTKQRWQNNKYIKMLFSKQWLIPVIIFLFLVCSIAVPVIALKGGIIPDRYVNAVVCFIVPLLLINIFIVSVVSPANISLPHPVLKKIFVYALLSIGVLCNNYIVDAYKSIIIAPVYNSILNEREAALKSAATGNKIAVVKDYDKALSEFFHTTYSGSPTTLRQIIQQKPPLLFFEDDLETGYSINVLKNYYGVDTIIVNKN